MLLAFTITLGLLIGSFLNVVVVRLPQDLSLSTPRSHCPKCKTQIAWYENIPVLSYLALRGKCRSCKNPISVRYPIIEVLTALLFVAVYFRTGWGPALWFRDWPFVASLVAMTFIDLELRILPDKLTLPGLVLGLLTAPLAPELGIVNSVIGAVVGFSFFYGLAWLYATLRKIDGLGGGDIKLLAMLGAFIGPLGVFYTVFISSVLGSVVGILVSKKGDLMQTAIPFGPFLIVGALVYYLIWDIVIQWLPFMNLI